MPCLRAFADGNHHDVQIALGDLQGLPQQSRLVARHGDGLPSCIFCRQHESHCPQAAIKRQGFLHIIFCKGLVKTDGGLG